MWFITEVLPGLIIFSVLVFVITQNIALRKKLRGSELKLDIEIPADTIAKMAKKINEATKRADDRNRNNV